MKELISNKIKQDDVISVGLPDGITVFTTQRLFREFSIFIEYIKLFKGEKDYIILVYSDENGFHRTILECCNKLTSSDVMYYLNEIIAFVSWSKGKKELIFELVNLWSEAYIFIPNQEEERTSKQSIVFIGIKAIQSIFNSTFEKEKLSSTLVSKESDFVIDEIIDSVGRKQKVRFFNYQD